MTNCVRTLKYTQSLLKPICHYTQLYFHTSYSKTPPKNSARITTHVYTYIFIVAFQYLQHNTANLYFAYMHKYIYIYPINIARVRVHYIPLNPLQSAIWPLATLAINRLAFGISRLTKYICTNTQISLWGKANKTICARALSLVHSHLAVNNCGAYNQLSVFRLYRARCELGELSDKYMNIFKSCVDNYTTTLARVRAVHLKSALGNRYAQDRLTRSYI